MKRARRDTSFSFKLSLDYIMKFQRLRRMLAYLHRVKNLDERAVGFA